MSKQTETVNGRFYKKSTAFSQIIKLPKPIKMRIIEIAPYSSLLMVSVMTEPNFENWIYTRNACFEIEIVQTWENLVHHMVCDYVPLRFYFFQDKQRAECILIPDISLAVGTMLYLKQQIELYLFNSQLFGTVYQITFIPQGYINLFLL